MSGFVSGRRRRSQPRIIEDVEEHVYSRLTTVCHLWPGITPWNVWDLPVGVWLGFADACDEYRRQMKESNG